MRHFLLRVDLYVLRQGEAGKRVPNAGKDSRRSLSVSGKQDLEEISQFKQESSLLAVGHEPYLSTMISEVVTGSGFARIVMKKARLAKVTVTCFQPRIKGELRWLLTPKLLKKVSK